MGPLLSAKEAALNKINQKHHELQQQDLVNKCLRYSSDWARPDCSQEGLAEALHDLIEQANQREKQREIAHEQTEIEKLRRERERITKEVEAWKVERSKLKEEVKALETEVEELRRKIGRLIDLEGDDYSPRRS